MIDIGLYVVYFLFFIAAGSALILPLLGALKHPKSLGKSGIAVAVLLVMFGISYALSGGELSPKWQALGVTTAFNSKLIGAGITMFYFTMICAILAIAYSEISKAFK